MRRNDDRLTRLRPAGGLLPSAIVFSVLAAIYAVMLGEQSLQYFGCYGSAAVAATNVPRFVVQELMPGRQPCGSSFTARGAYAILASPERLPQRGLVRSWR
jgi:hypothetical protein